MTEKEKPIFILPPPGEDDLTMGGHGTDSESSLTIPGQKKLDEDTAFGLPVRPARKDMPSILGSKYVDAPVYGVSKRTTLEDLAMLTGATIVNEELGDDMDLIQPDLLG